MIEKKNTLSIALSYFKYIDYDAGFFVFEY